MATVLKSRVFGIDSVRAFAALSVMLAHIIGPVLPDIFNTLHIGGASFSQYIFTGHPAVIAFFVVSGFCIHYPYTSQKPNAIAFWSARWIRILIPALLALLMAKLANLPKYNFIDGFILWSIVCELIYYTLYPLFYKLSRYMSWERQFFISLLISFAIALTLGSDQYGNAHKYGPALNWLVALPAWLIGCVLAERIADGAKLVDGSYIALKRFGIACIASVLYWLTMNTPVGFYLTMNLFSILVFFWISAEIAHAKEGVGIFENIGTWSYSIYLFHIIFFSVIIQIVGRADMVARLLSLPLVLLACYIMYRLVEKPAHALARRVFKHLKQRFPFAGVLDNGISNQPNK